MVTIKVQNCNSYVLTDDEEVKTNLWKSLRHRERGYFHSTLYKRKIWDGYTNFFSKETGKFLTGLLPEVEYALKYWKKEYTIKDEREPFEFVYKSIDKNFLNKWLPKGEKPIEMYDYQVDLVNQIIKYKRGVIQAPTSAGKTNILLGILHSMPENTPTLILANTKSLVNQIYKDMINSGFTNVGRLYDKYKEPNMFTCCTIQSLHKIEKLLPKIKAVFVDEIHLGMSKKPKKYYNKLEGCSVRVAISATPFKFGGKDKSQKYFVKGYFGPIMKTSTAGEGGVLTTEKLQKRKILSSSKCFFIPVTQPELPFAIYMDAVTQGIAENINLHKLVAKLVATLSGRTLILVERIAHGDALHSLIPQSLWIQGKDNLESRRYVIEKLQTAKEDTIGIATQQILGTGINVKLMNLINVAGGVADHQIIQKLGRGLRLADDKKQLNYFDFIFHINDYLLSHSQKRIKLLKKEGHDVRVFETEEEFWEELLNNSK